MKINIPFYSVALHPLLFTNQPTRSTPETMEWDIPENKPVVVVKKQVPPPPPPLPHSSATKKISYEDILCKMGMFVFDGKLHLLDHPEDVHKLLDSSSSSSNADALTPPHPQPQLQHQLRSQAYPPPPPHPRPRQPKTWHEYRAMLQEEVAQRNRIRQIKSKRMLWG